MKSAIYLFLIMSLIMSRSVYAQTHIYTINQAEGLAKDIETACVKAKQAAIAQAKQSAAIWILKQNTLEQSENGQSFKSQTIELSGVQARILPPVHEKIDVVGRQNRCTLTEINVQLDEEALEAQKEIIRQKMQAESERLQKIAELREQVQHNEQRYQTMLQQLPTLSIRPVQSQFICPEDQTLQSCLEETQANLEEETLIKTANDLNIPKKYLIVRLLSPIQRGTPIHNVNGDTYPFTTQGKYDIHLIDPYKKENQQKRKQIQALEQKTYYEEDEDEDHNEDEVVEEKPNEPDEPIYTTPPSQPSTPIIKWWAFSLEYDDFFSQAGLEKVNDIYVGGKSIGFHTYFTGKRPKGFGVALYAGSDTWHICTQSSGKQCKETKLFNLTFIQPSLHYNTQRFGFGLGWTHYLDAQALDANTQSAIGYATLWVSYAPFEDLSGFRFIFGIRTLQDTSKYHFRDTSKLGIKLLF